MSKSIKGIAAGGLLGMVGRNALSYPLQGKQSDAKKNVIRRKLGKTGIQLPIVSMGVMNTLNPDLVKRAYEIGVRHFDTAAYYMRGRNEQTIGSVIKDLGIRDQVIIGTKIYIPHPQRGMDSDKVKETYLRTAEESLKRLQTDYVDILYSHSVNSLDWLNHPGIIEALQSLKKQGKARFIGFSTHNNMAECIRDAARSGLYDVILTMFNYSLWDDQGMTDALKKAYSKKIGLVAMKTQCIREGGHWRDLPDSQRRYYEGSMMQTAILKWVLRHPFITTAIP
ncbi:MAG TPA: aldo/keto reductase, partial [bacterium]